jgi:glycosyltransferase involved in cell wall biosynthesis
MQVSVIIPTFNGQAFLQETLQSVLAQRSCDFEVIVIDDGSMDDTALILESYKNSIRVYRQDNRGPAAAMNSGAQIAIGKYLAFCDHDDLWAPDHLASLLGFLEMRPKAGLAFSNAAFFQRDRADVYRLMMRDKYLRLLERRDLRPRDLFLKLIVTTLSVVMVSKSAFDAVGGFNEKVRMQNDGDLALRMSLDHEIAFLNNVTCYRRMHRTSLSATMNYCEEGYLRIIEEFDASHPTFRAKIGPLTFRLRLAKEFTKLARRCIQKGDIQSAKQAYKRAKHLAWWNPWYYWHCAKVPGA